jgi:UDP-glucose 4-epimerase
MRVLVTGASGFVASTLIPALLSDPQFVVRGAYRHRPARLPSAIECVDGELEGGSDWGDAVRGVDTIVHLAARVHVMRDQAADPLGEFRRVNVQGTLNLARQAAAAGVRRFVFLSSIKVNGEAGAFSEGDRPAPADAYGVSKYEAEMALGELGATAGMDVVIVRPPLVYGPGVRANFAALMAAIARGVPLPLGAVHNRRSLIAADNLAHFLVRCVTHPAAANETFLVSDGEDLSTTALVRRLAAAMGRRVYLLPVPPSVIRAAAAVAGRRDAAARLLDSLSVDITKARQRLSWAPPLSVDAALARAAVQYR